MARQVTPVQKATKRTQVSQLSAKVIELFKQLQVSDAIDTLEKCGMGTEFFTCYMCGRVRRRNEFYVSTDTNVKSGVCRICKDCVDNLIYGLDGDKKGVKIPKHKALNALEYLDRPYFEDLMDASIIESKTYPEKWDNYWKAYVKNTGSLAGFTRYRWRDGDNFRKTYKSLEMDISADFAERDLDSSSEVVANFDANKRDVLRFVGYDPFYNYPNEEDKPILYANLVSMLDDETKNDGMKLAAVIQIVKKMHQAEKINDQIDRAVCDYSSVMQNQGTINKLADTSSKLIASANALAKDNGISVNHNQQKSKGASTLSGKIKALEQIGLRDASINTFDIGTCEGMRQIAEISEEARHKTIG